MKTIETSEVALVRRCAETIEEAATRLRPRFRRQAAARHAADDLRGLVADVGRKNGW